MHEEKPLTKRTRIIIVVVLWIVATPLLVAVWVFFSWWTLALVAAAVWATYDYVKRGDQFGAADSWVTREGTLFHSYLDDDHKRS